MNRDIENIAWEIEDKLYLSSLESTAVDAVLEEMLEQIKDIIYEQGYDVDARDVRDIISVAVFKNLNI